MGSFFWFLWSTMLSHVLSKSFIDKIVHIYILLKCKLNTNSTELLASACKCVARVTITNLLYQLFNSRAARETKKKTHRSKREEIQCEQFHKVPDKRSNQMIYAWIFSTCGKYHISTGPTTVHGKQFRAVRRCGIFFIVAHLSLKLWQSVSRKLVCASGRVCMCKLLQNNFVDNVPLLLSHCHFHFPLWSRWPCLT